MDLNSLLNPARGSSSPLHPQTPPNDASSNDIRPDGIFTCPKFSNTFGAQEYIHHITNVDCVSHANPELAEPPQAHGSCNPHNRLTCPKYLLTFSSNHALARHTKKICNIPNRMKHQCPLCPKLLTSAPLVKRHVNTIHSDLKSFPCRLCEKSFNQSCNRSAHITAVHDKIKAFQCDDCDSKFTEAGSRKRHIRTRHPFAPSRGREPKSDTMVD